MVLLQLVQRNLRLLSMHNYARYAFFMQFSHKGWNDEIELRDEAIKRSRYSAERTRGDQRRSLSAYRYGRFQGERYRLRRG